jgi:hypothetical protein
MERRRHAERRTRSDGSEWATDSRRERQALLRKRGFKPAAARSGGGVWTKAMPKGRSAVVRIDPPKARIAPRGWGDEVAHAHKEIVPTAMISNRGNFPELRATTFDDGARRTLDPQQTHIPIGP